MTLDEIKRKINEAQDILIVTHESPDGDAIGSSLAMNLVLKKLGKNVDVVIPKCPKAYKFLPSSEDIKLEGRDDKPYDLAIALDCADLQRLNGFAKWFEDAKVKISIDHHQSNKMFADYNYVDPVAPACAQILITIINSLGVEMDKEIGTCIIAGIITDTGGFKYESVTAETFEFAARLLNTGVNISDTYKKLFQNRTISNFKLSKLVMDRMEFLENGRIAFSYITLKDEEEVEAQSGDHEGLVDIGKEIEGVEVSVFLREKEKGFKVSLRANNYVNVSDVCMVFGGGGHPRAAGCTIQLPLEQAKERIISYIKPKLKD